VFGRHKPVPWELYRDFPFYLKADEYFIFSEVGSWKEGCFFFFSDSRVVDFASGYKLREDDASVRADNISEKDKWEVRKGGWLVIVGFFVNNRHFI
jgi:hypothetical protein